MIVGTSLTPFLGKNVVNEQSDLTSVYLEMPQRDFRLIEMPMVPPVGTRIQVDKGLAVDNVDCTIEVTKHEWRLRPVYCPETAKMDGVDLSLYVHTKEIVE
jgi:hypothetical protein